MFPQVSEKLISLIVSLIIGFPKMVGFPISHPQCYSFFVSENPWASWVPNVSPILALVSGVHVFTQLRGPVVDVAVDKHFVYSLGEETETEGRWWWITSRWWMMVVYEGNPPQTMQLFTFHLGWWNLKKHYQGDKVWKSQTRAGHAWICKSLGLESGRHCMKADCVDNLQDLQMERCGFMSLWMSESASLTSDISIYIHHWI